MFESTGRLALLRTCPDFATTNDMLKSELEKSGVDAEYDDKTFDACPDSPRVPCWNVVLTKIYIYISIK